MLQHTIFNGTAYNNKAKQLKKRMDPTIYFFQTD